MNDIIEEQQDMQITRYLREQLSAEEKAQFEIRMIEEPELLERVQFLEALQLGLKAEEKSLLEDGDNAPASNVLPFRRWLRQPLSLAASVLVAALGVNTVVNRPQTDSVPDAVPVGAVLLLETRRDVSLPTFTGAGPYLIQIDAGLGTQASTVDIALHDADGAVLLSQQDLNIDRDGWIRLLYTQPLSGEYRLDVETTDGATVAVVLSYPFAVN
jgi:hypothetical protein